MEPKQENFSISKATLEATLAFLQTQPYKNVAGLITEILKARPIEEKSDEAKAEIEEVRAI